MSTNKEKQKQSSALDAALVVHKQDKKLTRVLEEVSAFLTAIGVGSLSEAEKRFVSAMETVVELEARIDDVMNSLEEEREKAHTAAGRVALLLDENKAMKVTLNNSEQELSKLRDVLSVVRASVGELDAFILSPYVQQSPQIKVGNATMRHLKRHLDIEVEVEVEVES